MIRDQNSQDAFCCCCSAAQSRPTLCKPTDYSMPGFPSITISRSLLKLMFTELVMPPNHLILCCPHLSPRSIVSKKSVLHIRWPNYWSFSFSISPSNEYSGLLSFRMDWLDLLAVQGTPQESSPAPQFKSINSLAVSFLYGPTFTSTHD